jgi:hypothetical protein
MEPIRRSLTYRGRRIEFVPDFPEARLLSFLSNVDFSSSPSGCWLWSAAKRIGGYGVTSWNNRSRAAHRLAWEAMVGPIPSGMLIHHKCNNPSCVNPEHLEPTSFRVHNLVLSPTNITAINSQLTHCKRGHELSGENVYVYPGLQKRRCKTCYDAWQHNRQENKVKHPKSAWTHCKRGHEYTPENTYVYRGVRQCKACHNDLTLRRYHEKQADLAGRPKEPAKPRALRTQCKFGHPLTDDNVVIVKEGQGRTYRRCKICVTEYMRKYNAAIKAEKEAVEAANQPSSQQ